MRRAAELAADMKPTPVFLMHVPKTWQTATAQTMYQEELHRLGRFLIQLGGESPGPEKLANLMRQFERTRASLRQARLALGPAQFAEAIAHFNQTGTMPIDVPAPKLARQGVLNSPIKATRPANRIPLALVGCPLLQDQGEIFSLLEAAGGEVVLDATTNGERSLPSPWACGESMDDPFQVLVKAYFGGIPEAFRRPNTALYLWLKDKFAERGVKGIIFRRYIWCDTWHAEAQRMKEWAEVPLLDLEVGDEVKLNAHTISRIQSFIEMLRLGSFHEPRGAPASCRQDAGAPGENRFMVPMPGVVAMGAHHE